MGEPRWVKRFTEHGAPGAYLRVLHDGDAGAGDPVIVDHRPDHGVTIGDVFPIRRASDDGLRRLLELPGLNGELAAAARRDLAARAR
jgi:MOSC domain-containing protein YiiM